MLAIRKMMIDNKILSFGLSIKLKVARPTLDCKIYKIRDFTIKELEAIKKIFVAYGIIDKNFDIGCFLDEV